MLTPSGLTQFKGINAALMERILERSTLLPCINGGVWFNGRLEANEAGDPDDIGYETKAIAQNQDYGFGIEIPEGQVWFPYWVQQEVAFNTSTSYDCTFTPINLETKYTRLRRNAISEFQWSVPVSNQYAAFTGNKFPAAPFYRIGENPHNLTGSFKPQLYLGMWPSRSTVWFAFNADNVAGITGGVDRMLFRIAANIVYTGEKYLEQLRDTSTADREIIRRIMAESATGFPNVDL